MMVVFVLVAAIAMIIGMVMLLVMATVTMVMVSLATHINDPPSALGLRNHLPTFEPLIFLDLRPVLVVGGRRKVVVGGGRTL